jgi:hypothetical protein
VKSGDADVSPWDRYRRGRTNRTRRHSPRPWYFNFHNTRGLALHQYDLPGYPASHACIRLLERDARWIYEWGEGWTLDAREITVIEPGTPLLIVGQFAFGEPSPWRSLDHLARGIALPVVPSPREHVRR